MDNREEYINRLWEDKDRDYPDSEKKRVQEYLSEIIRLLDKGIIRVVNKDKKQWITNQWIKKAILLSFKFFGNKIYNSYSDSSWFDKVESKFSHWRETDFENTSIRAVPGSYVRKGSFIGKNCVLMPSFVNIGAYIDDGTLVDTWATIGSCAQIGKNCHISGGVGIAGVLEPLQTNPVIIEDHCFIGARSEIAEGVIVREGSVISMGVFLGQSTRIYDRETKQFFYGEIPPYSVVVPGTMPSDKDGLNLYAAIIVKKVDKRTREKTSINSLLRTNV